MSSVGNPWSSLTAVQKAMLAIGIPASAVVVYILYRRFRESRDEPYVLVGDDQIAVDMRVPRDAVKIIIGRQGSTIKQLRKETGARIEVEDSEETGGYEGPAERVLTVVGSPVQVCKAKVAIHQLLADSMKITEELHVPHRAVGRIIGRGGESIREICRTTGAKIVCEKETSEQILDTRRSVKISGTKQEVASARALIVAKVEEEETFRQKLASSAARRRQRKHPIGARTEQVSPAHSGEGIAASPASEGGEWALDTSEDEVDHRTNPTITTEQEKEEGASEKDGQPGNHSSQVSKFEIPSPDFSFLPDEHLEVYVSASENPNHFWIQILGSRCLQLDNLTYEMSRYYRGCSGMREDFTPKLGDIVAAPFQGDSSWYRARVLSFLESGIADLYYVDYGDNGEIPIGKLQILRTDFLSLPFQAVECSLDEIQPVGEVWSDEAMNCFDGLTYCAEWKVLLARICSYSQSGDVTRPQVKLFDRTRDQNLDIGEELIRLGHATRCPQTLGATVGDGLGAGGKSTTTSLQALLNDVAGGLDGSLVSELCTRSPGEQLSTSWQTYSAGHSSWADLRVSRVSVDATSVSSCDLHYVGIDMRGAVWQASSPANSLLTVPFNWATFLAGTADYSRLTPSPPSHLATLSDQEDAEDSVLRRVLDYALSPPSVDDVTVGDTIGSVTFSFSDSRDADRSGSETEPSLYGSEGVLLVKDEFL